MTSAAAAATFAPIFDNAKSASFGVTSPSAFLGGGMGLSGLAGRRTVGGLSPLSMAESARRNDQQGAARPIKVVRSKSLGDERKSLGPTRKSERSAKETFYSKSPTVLEPSAARRFKGAEEMYSLVRKLCSKDCGFGVGDRSRFIFVKPVDETQFPDYRTYVQRPICLDDVLYKLVFSGYNGVEEVFNDVRRVFTNAQLYNGELNVVHQWAADFLKYFDTEFSMLFDAKFQRLRRGTNKAASSPVPPLPVNAMAALAAVSADFKLQMAAAVAPSAGAGGGAGAGAASGSSSSSPAAASSAGAAGISAPKVPAAVKLTAVKPAAVKPAAPKPQQLGGASLSAAIQSQKRKLAVLEGLQAIELEHKKLEAYSAQLRRQFCAGDVETDDESDAHRDEAPVLERPLKRRRTDNGPAAAASSAYGSGLGSGSGSGTNI